MSEKIARPVWLDDASVAQFKKAEEMDGQFAHLIYDEEEGVYGFISTFRDGEELATALRHVLARVESGEYERSRKEINLEAPG
jgi:hypothetical protein